MNIIPAILEKDFLKIIQKIQNLYLLKTEYNLPIRNIQIDICDGVFVENTTWLPEDIVEINSLASFVKDFEFEYHLMCEDQAKYYLIAKKLKAKKIILHIDEIFNSEVLKDIINDAFKEDIEIFICAKLDFLEEHKDKILELLIAQKEIGLQIMGINKIGVQGQTFDERCLTLIKFFREKFDKDRLYIQIDGSMNEVTSKEVKVLNVNAIVVGSYLVGNTKSAIFINNFKKL